MFPITYMYRISHYYLFGRSHRIKVVNMVKWHCLHNCYCLRMDPADRLIEFVFPSSFAKYMIFMKMPFLRWGPGEISFNYYYHTYVSVLFRLLKPQHETKMRYFTFGTKHKDGLAFGRYDILNFVQLGNFR